MFTNYIKIAIRNIFKHKAYSFLNIFGLAIGLASTIIILLWVNYEFSYDEYHTDKEQIFSLCQTQVYPSGPLKTFMTSGPIAAKIKADYPEIEYASRLRHLSKVVQYQEKTFDEVVSYADSDIFSIFRFDLIMGNRSDLFKDYNSAVISKSTAHKYFGDNNPIGEVLKFGDKKSFKISGVFEDIPSTSSVGIAICVPFEHLKDLGYDLEQIGYNAYFTWLKLKKNSTEDSFNAKLQGYYQKMTGNTHDVTFWVWPLSKAHLYSFYQGGLIKTIILFVIVAVFIMLIACINFMNLATARSTLRSKEIGLRKVLGSSRKKIINQFLGESFITTLIAISMACLIVEILLPTFNSLTDKEISFSLLNTKVLLGIAAITLVTSIVAGSYPALYLSAFKPISVLKGVVVKGKSGATFRRVLVVFQFTLSIALIIGTIIIQKQLAYILDKDIGLNRENVIVVDIKNEINKNFAPFKNTLLQNPRINAVTRGGDLPFNIGSNTSSIEWEGKEDSQDTPIGFVDFDYDMEKTMQMQLKYGRFFSREFRTDSVATVINESMAKLMGEENPVGKFVNWGGEHPFKIIGVVKNFHFSSFENGIKPLCMFYFDGRYRKALIKIASGSDTESIKFIENTWNKYFPNYPFKYSYMDDKYQAMYKEQKLTNELFTYFSILAIIISCLGLFGLASYMAEQKTKEIGIRKALGASISKIVSIMSIEFIKWVAVANIISWPIAWFFGKRFLDQYVYKTKLSPEIFISAAVLSILIAIITISYQSFKAARGNPVNALRYE